jgi:hypothetical protein
LSPPRRFAAFAAALLSGAAAFPASAASVWATDGTEKIRPGAAPRTAATVHVSAARNEFEPFQIAVVGPAGGVRASATSLAGPGAIPAPRLYREALIDLRYPSALDGAAGRWPDALVPDVDGFDGEPRNAFPFDVPAGETRAIWADVFVPPGTPPGEYAGTVHVTWSGGEASVPVTLTVRPFTLPSTASLASAFGFHYGAIPAAHGLSGDGLAALRARYGVLALDHRVTLSHVDDGSRSLDHLASFYGAALDGTAATLLPDARMTSAELMGPAQEWATFFDARGWLNRLFQYTCDEPPLTCAWSDIPARAASARTADPELRTLVTTTIQEADEHGVTSSIDVLVPVVNFLDDRPGNSRFEGNQRAAYDGFLAGSPRREVWGYQSCMSHGCGGTVDMGSPSESDRYFTGWPSYVIDASAVRNRAMQWLAFRYRLAGELYYETAMAYGHDPWTNQWDFSGNGDGTLFYPGTPARIGGTTHVPVASIRLEMIREGMEDFEYLALLSSAGGDAEARAIADRLFPNAYSTDVAPAVLMAAREEIAQRIVALGATGSAVVGSGGAHDVPVAGGCAAGSTGAASLLAVVPGVLAIRLRRRGVPRA